MSGRDTAKRRADQAAISRRKAGESREIGGIPDIADPDRRAACRNSLRLFCETYNPEAFSLGWSADHLAAIARIEEAATAGALYAFAMPRGSGKSTVCRMAALWAASYALKRYVYLIGASADKGEDALDAIKTYVRFLPLYAADFPEISWPAVCLAGIAQRAGGQTCDGESTNIEWGKGRVILPTVPPPQNWPKDWPLRSDGKVPTAGVVLGVSGLTGEGIRGSNLTLTTGEAVRPDFALLDDPQTDESARSKSQNASREALIAGAVLGMAGPGKGISAVMPCTVIAPGDMIDRLLDRSKHPLWRGHRTRMLRSMPRDMEAWREYFEVYYRCALLEPPDFTEANVAYLANRDKLDAGAEAAWPDRKEPREVSAVQHAMHIFARDERAFWAEYQNEPVSEREHDQKELDPRELCGRLNRVPGGEVPRECTRLTAFIDCSARLLWYVVVGWDEAFGGGVVDYGAWPRQRRGYWTQSDAAPSLVEEYPGLAEPARVYEGLKGLAGWLMSRRFPRHGGGEAAGLSQVMIDSGWQTDAVLKFVKHSEYGQRGFLLPSKGFAATTTARSVDEWPKRDGERRGPGWRLGADTIPGRGKRVAFDADHWKSFVADRLLTHPASPGALLLYGDNGAAHRMLCDHLTAEYATPVVARGRRFDKWQARADHADNHLLDCLVGAAVAASVQGAAWSASGAETPQAAKAKVRLSDLQRAKREGVSR